MQKQFSDTESLSRERENVFDKYYNKIEQLRLNSFKKDEKTHYPDYLQIERALNILERNLYDLGDLKSQRKEIVLLGNVEVDKMLREWSDTFVLLGSRKSFIADFSYNILVASSILFNLPKLDVLSFRKYMKRLSPRRNELLKYNSRLKNISLDTIADYENILKITDPDELRNTIESIFSNIYRDKMRHNKHNSRYVASLSLKERRKKNLFKSIYFELLLKEEVEDFRRLINNEESIAEIDKEVDYPFDTNFEWILELKFDNDKKQYSASELSFTIWAISEALEKIEGVSVSLVDCGVGSFWFKLILKIKGVVAREEVKQVLNKSKEALEANYIDKPIEETKKIAAEREQIEKTTRGITDEKDSKKITQLEIEKLEIANEAAKIEVMKSKLELINGVSQLVRDGIIQNDSDFQLMVNNMLFFEKKKTEIFTGENIEIIEEEQVVKKGKDDKLKA